jgi:hypothetical protein
MNNKNKLLTISYLHHRREHFNIFSFFLNKIKKENKEKIHVKIMTIPNHEHLFKDKLEDISYEIISFPYGLNYGLKIRNLVNSDTEYVAKWDEDIYINNHVIDYCIENLNLLNDPKNISIAPILSTGVPTCDWFIEQMLDEEDRNIIHDIFLRTKMGFFCVDYSEFNHFTVNAKKWEYEKFYEAVKSYYHVYRGINPMRCSLEAQKTMMELMLKDKYVDKFLEKNDYSISYSDRIYMCNSIFFIRKELYKQIWENESLRVDPYDEVQLNETRRINDMRWLFINNGFGIHPAYNWVDLGREEDIFYHKFLEAINERFIFNYHSRTAL